MRKKYIYIYTVIMSIAQFTYPSLWLLVAPPGSGKSYFIRHMITELLLKNKFKYGVVFASAAFNDDYNWLDDASVHSGYDENILKSLIQLQVAAKEQTGAFPPCFVVLDDCLGANFATPWFVNLVGKYRHYNITMIFAVQRLKSLKSPILYSCCKYAIIFYNESESDLKILYENVAGGIAKSWRDLKTLIATQCQDHACLIVDRATADRAKKCLRYRAPSRQKNIKFTFE